MTETFGVGVGPGLKAGFRTTNASWSETPDGPCAEIVIRSTPPSCATFPVHVLADTHGVGVDFVGVQYAIELMPIE